MFARSQVIEFHPRHREAVLAGIKTVTVRWNDAIAIGPAVFVFDPQDATDAVSGSVISVERVRADELTAEAVRASDDTDMDDFVRQLRDNYYPSMPADAQLDVVVFRVGDYEG